MAAKKATPKKPAKPTKYMYDSTHSPKLARFMASIGKTDQEMADEIGISRSTFSTWKVKYKEFAEAIKAGKREPDDQVVGSLYNSARGYYVEETTTLYDAEGEVTGMQVVKKWIKADNGSIVFWLSNRDKENWKRMKQVDVTIVDDSAKELANAVNNIGAE